MKMLTTNIYGSAVSSSHLDVILWRFYAYPHFSDEESGHTKRSLIICPEFTQLVSGSQDLSPPEHLPSLLLMLPIPLTEKAAAPQRMDCPHHGHDRWVY